MRLDGILEEALNRVQTKQAIVEWLGGLISLCCSVAALSYWTSFRISRKFCLIGWLSMMLTPALTAAMSPNHALNWDKTQESIKTTAVEVWQDITMFVSTKPCQEVTDQIAYLSTSVSKFCAYKRTIKYLIPKKYGIKEACDQFRTYYGTDVRKSLMERMDTFCKKSVQIVEDGPKTRPEFEAEMDKHLPFIMSAIRMWLGTRAGIANVLRILPAVVAMVPALMQGGLMVKNLVPMQTMPSILTTLPWAYTIVAWVEYQVYYQFMDDWMFLIAILFACFGPMVYYVWAKYYDLHQPMCDQQSITITFRLWYYALLTAILAPYVTLVIYIVYFNTFLHDTLYQNLIGVYLSPNISKVLAFLCGTVMNYAYTLQAGIDWFVDELVLHHMATHAPLVIATTKDVEEARKIAQQLHTQIDVDSIQQGTYVCGGLSDKDRLYPPKEGSWTHKAETYAISLTRKDFSTLDAFTAHTRGDKEIPGLLDRGRSFFLQVDGCA